MANLKSDLDQYLLQNETRKSYKISLPFSTPSFLSRTPPEDSPTSTSSAGSWLDEVQKEYFTLVSATTYFLLLFSGIKVTCLVSHLLMKHRLVIALALILRCPRDRVNNVPGLCTSQLSNY